MFRRIFGFILAAVMALSVSLVVLAEENKSMPYDAYIRPLHCLDSCEDED
ncbi:MAG: hypothetical protein FWB74_08010 [Defluviitaleaceae bacterium]|nr:hypothetical protein [Defluviitaleaceae bacterium]